MSSRNPNATLVADTHEVKQTLVATCVDLDGTLIAGDVFLESLLQLLRRKPLLCLLLPAWLMRGKAYTKRRVAREVTLRPETLLYRREVLDFLDQSRTEGRTLVLATAADEEVARSVASHLGIFAHVLASDGNENLSGDRKAARLEAMFGRGRFEYVGNDWADLPAWLVAGRAIAVAAPSGALRSLRNRACAVRVLVHRRLLATSIVRAMRPHQWAKNLLVFTPLVSAHSLLNPEQLMRAVWMFVAFSLCASSAYVFNDINDIEVDRLHPRKRERPFASGHLSIPLGLGLAVALLGAGLGLGAALSVTVLGVLTVYLVLTLAYTAWLKREPVADVFVLAGLYVLRVVAGGVATGIQLTTWLLAFALFIFLSLAFVKRYTELSGVGRAPGRGYSGEDCAWMHGIGISSGYMATLVLALYVTAPDVTALYTHPRVLLLLCPILLFWITRMWFKAGRGVLHHDPVVEALRDPVGYGCALTGAVVLFFAL